MTTEAIADGDQSAAPPETGSYIGRHWRGELSLAQSYWLNGVVIGLPFQLYFQGLALVAKAQPFETPLASIEWIVVPFLLMQPIAIWQGVGIWRSAGQRIREGKPGWSWVARIIVLINLVLLLFNAVIYSRLVFSLSTSYLDQRSAHYEVSSTGDRVVFSGEITPASADALVPLLQESKINRLVVRQSIGGYVLPALRIAKVIHDRKLTVVSTFECASMCAALLASGAQRFIMPTTVIALHSAIEVGTNLRSTAETEAVEAIFRQAGMKSELLAKIRAHSGRYDVYEPTLREIIDNGLATHIYDAPTNGYLPGHEWCDENPFSCGLTGRLYAVEQRAAHWGLLESV
jgi:ATP-dependent protease ClpP protease subunit